MFYFIAMVLFISMLLSVPIKMEQPQVDPNYIWKSNLESNNLFEDV